jgi:SAM-dependent methyltransferase
MIERARTRAADAGAAISFAVADAQEDDLGGPYDAVMSRFGVMFFADPVRAFANIVAAVRPGGRLAFVCWQPLDRNPWMTGPTEVLRSLMDDPPPAAPAGAGPFAFGETDFVRRVLTDAGWTDPGFTSVDIEIRMGGEDGVAGAVNQALDSSMARALLATGGAPLRERATAVLTEQFAALAVGGVVRFPAAVWLVTATKPS